MKNDERYQKIMSAYKVARRDPKRQEQAERLLQEAWDMEDKGEVSEDVIMGMKYL